MIQGEYKSEYRTVTFTIQKPDWEMWQRVIKGLVTRRHFKSKTDAFVSLAYFLNNASEDEIDNFKRLSVIRPLELPEELN
jgi:hypothetical protein